MMTRLGLFSIAPSLLHAYCASSLIGFSAGQATVPTMTYRASGTGRDSYIAGVGRVGRPAAHNIAARRDNLPDNVFQYLKDQAAREQYEAFCYEQQKAKDQAMQGLRGGKRIVPADDGAEEEQMRFASVQASAERHLKLKALYQREMHAWSAELAEKGLAIDPSS